MWDLVVSTLHLDKPEVVGTYVAGVGLAFWKGVLPSISKWTTKKFLKGDPGPTAPKEVEVAAEPLPPTPEPIHAQLSEVAKAMAEWTIDEARRRVRELQIENDELQRQHWKLEYQLEDTTRDNVRTSRALAASNIELERLQGELVQAQDAAAASELRARRAALELADYKKEVSSGHSGSAIVTPLRPRPIR